MKPSRGSTRTLSLLLALESIIQSAVVSRADAHSEAGNETLLVEDWAFIEEMIMAHATKHTMAQLRSIVGELMNEGWHAFVHSSFEFSIVVWIRFIAKGIDTTLVRATTTTTVARGRVLPITWRRGTTRRRARHVGKLRRAVRSSQIIAQSNSQVARGQIIAGSRIKLVNPS